MEKCRLCLGNKKNLRSIFDVEDDHTFAYMIISISNIKINKDEGITDKICLGCRKKLREAFDFKLMIERSDAALQDSLDCKKIYFDNLKDIKIKIEIDEYIPKYNNKCEIIDGYFKDGEASVFYNSTTIKKLEPSDFKMEKENQSLTLLDFLNTFKGDSENDINDNCDVDIDYEPISDDYDDEYLLPLSMRRKQKNNHNKKKKRDLVKGADRKKYNYKSKLISVSKPIRPVFLGDLRVVPSKTKNERKPRSSKKNRIETKKQMCNYCGKFFNCSSSFKKHLLTHTGERSFKCELCSKGFLTESDLRAHEKRHVQSKERTEKCELCVAVFGSKEALKSHMISHSEEKKYICDVCSKPFKRKGAMRRHKIAHNVTNKNIKCELCNMSFFTRYGLNHHMRIHTGERPYNCEICSQPYSYKHDFNRHCLKKHGVFLKRRSVNVMNDEVLMRERALMRDLMLKVHGFVNDGEIVNPFEGPQGAQAFEMAVKALKAKQIPLDII